jgi:hypothetical protein
MWLSHTRCTWATHLGTSGETASGLACGGGEAVGGAGCVGSDQHLRGAGLAGSGPSIGRQRGQRHLKIGHQVFQGFGTHRAFLVSFAAHR